MKLTYFSIQNYRSITSAKLDNLQGATILIGPNNEGKSNVLRSLNTCLMLLKHGRKLQSRDRMQLRYDRELYDWVTDYPVPKQQKNPSGKSVFDLHFKLSEAEQHEFRKVIGSKLNDILPIQVSFGDKQFATFKILKQGRGGPALTQKHETICNFIAQTLDFVYIPAIRPATTSLELVNNLVSRELQHLEKNPQYAALQQKLQELQMPVLEGIAAKLTKSLQGYFGIELKEVSLSLVDRYRYQRFGRTCQITVDDGIPTPLERKGDGVQSLAAISLMIGALQETGIDKDIIVLLEEPESHLHPKAIHQLRDILDNIGQDSQLIFTTHCPLLINRANVTSNLVVSKNNVSTAKSLEVLRDILGVRPSDNLQHAALIIVVEGKEDEVALNALLTHYSTKLRDGFLEGSLAFHVINGASKLSNALSMLQSFICNYYVVLDDDEEGRKGHEKAKQAQLISLVDTTFTKCLGLPEAEFEDLLSPDLYVGYFQDRYGVDVKHRSFKQKKKWSNRIRHGLIQSGKQWSEEDEYKDKHEIAKLVVDKPAGAIHPIHEGVIMTLITSLEEKLHKLSAGKSK